MSVSLLAADLVESNIDDVPLGAVVVVCDLDAAHAEAVASRVTGHRTAVFVGRLDSDTDRAAAEEFAKELFGESD